VIVVDASVLANAVGDDGVNRPAEQELDAQDAELHAQRENRSVSEHFGRTDSSKNLRTKGRTVSAPRRSDR
jgi:hypothetical protein